MRKNNINDNSTPRYCKLHQHYHQTSKGQRRSENKMADQRTSECDGKSCCAVDAAQWSVRAGLSDRQVGNKTTATLLKNRPLLLFIHFLFLLFEQQILEIKSIFTPKWTARTLISTVWLKYYFVFSFWRDNPSMNTEIEWKICISL